MGPRKSSESAVLLFTFVLFVPFVVNAFIRLYYHRRSAAIHLAP